MTPIDEQMMLRALELAERGRGRVEPNPVVGAVVTQGETVVGEGWHQAFGGPHAEVHALKAAGERARGATLYVTLEPCSHFGKTPPCTDAVIAAGISRVVAAMQDPFHQVSGSGFAKLRDAGIKVEVGLCENQAQRINAPFVKLNIVGIPFVIAKWAMTLDGKTATVSGASTYISGDASRAIVHQLRDRVDAVVIGIRTALADDPLLTCRLPNGRNPRRIIIDTHAQLPLTSKLVKTVADAPVWVACGKSAPADAVSALEDAGCRVILLPELRDGVDVEALAELLGTERLTNVLVEGGSTVLASFFEAKLVDRVVVFVAPKLLGGKDAPTPIGGRGLQLLEHAYTVADAKATPVGSDLMIEGDVVYSDADDAGGCKGCGSRHKDESPA